MAVNDRFSAGDSAGRIFTKEYQNRILERIARLEKMTAYAPLDLMSSSNGFALSLAQRIDNFELVELTEDLDSLSTAEADILIFTESAESARDDTLPLTVTDIFSIDSKSGTPGLALKHPKSDSEKWVFFPIAVQVEEPNAYYDSTYSISNQNIISIYNSYILIDVNLNIKRTNNFFQFDCDEQSHYQLDDQTPVACMLDQNGSFTAWICFQLDNTGQDQTIFSVGPEDQTPEVELGYTFDRREIELLLLERNETTPTTISHPLPINSNRFYCVWVTYNHCLGRVRIWVGDEFGNTKAAIESTAITCGLKDSANQIFRIGRSVDSAANKFFCGFMRDFFFQSKELDPEALCKRWNKGIPKRYVTVPPGVNIFATNCVALGVNCDIVTNQFTVSFSDVTDGVTGCCADTVNTTFTITYDDDTCTWIGVGPDTSCVNAGPEDIVLQFLSAGENPVWELNMGFQLYQSEFSGWNCQDKLVLTIFEPENFDICGNLPITVTITPV